MSDDVVTNHVPRTLTEPIQTLDRSLHRPHSPDTENPAVPSNRANRPQRPTVNNLKINKQAPIQHPEPRPTSGAPVSSHLPTLPADHLTANKPSTTPLYLSQTPAPLVPVSGSA